MSDISLGLRNLHLELLRRGIRSVALPALGVGLGGLDWRDVREIIEREFGDQSAIEVTICNPRRISE